VTAQRARYRAGTLTYTARLRQHTAPGPQRKTPDWLGSPWPVALLTLGAEAGHLTAAFTEWPTSIPRGVFHTFAAALQGLAAVALYFGLFRFDKGSVLAFNAVTAASWPVGVLLGVSPYRHYPVPAAIAVTAVEAALAVLTAMLRRAPKPNPADKYATRKRHVHPRA
jgi:hypothetical protein